MSIIVPWSDDSFFPEAYKFLQSIGVLVKGVLHIGAHLCEEKDEYNNLGIADDNILWIEGNTNLVEQMKYKGIKNIYKALVDDSEKTVTFNITNNGASSSIYSLGVHKYFYPQIHVVETRQEKTTTLEKLFHENNFDASKYNYWSLDIQGAELAALKGAGSLLQHADALLIEVNFDHLYEGIPLIDTVDSFLEEKGFVRTHTKIAFQRWGDALYVRKSHLNK